MNPPETEPCLTEQLMELRAERDLARQELAEGVLRARQDADMWCRIYHARLSVIEAYEHEAKLTREWVKSAQPIVRAVLMIVDQVPELESEEDLYLWAVGKIQGAPVVLQPRHGRRRNPLFRAPQRDLSHVVKMEGPSHG